MAALKSMENKFRCLFIDINECEGSNNCDINANCTNTQGNYTCSCNTGYHGDGVNCSG